MSPDSGCQRWRNGRGSYRPAGELIDPGRHRVVRIDEADAKSFVQQHHYARSYPAARARFGLLRKDAGRAERLVGCAVFSVPMNQRAIPHHAGHAPDEGCELGRFVLLDEVEGMAESWFLSRCLRALPELLPGVTAVVSYADPIPRASTTGQLIKPGHLGIVYQALSALYRGRSSARTLWLAGDGSVLSGRMLSKLSTGDRGSAHAYATLRRHGAPARRTGEADAAYVRRALEEGAFRRLRHPGNHVYVFPAGSPAQRRAARHRMPEGDSYPNATAPRLPHFS